MKLIGFPGCCNAFVGHDFGGSGLAAGKKSVTGKTEIRNWLNMKIITHGSKCLVIMTNDQQTEANSVLLELGFKHSTWMSKQQHPESKIRLWWRKPS